MKEFTATCKTCKAKVYFYSEKELVAGDKVNGLMCMSCGNTVKAIVD